MKICPMDHPNTYQRKNVLPVWEEIYVDDQKNAAVLMLCLLISAENHQETPPRQKPGK